MTNAWLISALWIFFAASAASASAVDDARKLNDEAQDALRKMSGSAADPKAYAEVVHKLEKAQGLLEEAVKSGAKGAESLAQSVSAALFWARRFSSLNLAKEPAKTPGGKALDAAAGEAEFKKAEDFEKAHQGDDYPIALRWFQYSDQFSGTNLSLRALARAYEAQARYRAAEAAKKAAAEAQTEGGKLLLAGNDLYMKKDFEGALAKFEQARKSSDLPWLNGGSATPGSSWGTSCATSTPSSTCR